MGLGKWRTHWPPSWYRALESRPDDRSIGPRGHCRPPLHKRKCSNYKSVPFGCLNISRTLALQWPLYLYRGIGRETGDAESSPGAFLRLSVTFTESQRQRSLRAECECLTLPDSQAPTTRLTVRRIFAWGAVQASAYRVSHPFSPPSPALIPFQFKASLFSYLLADIFERPLFGQLD